MPKRLPTQPKGGKNPDGTGARSPNPKRNAGHALSQEVIKAIADLPQVKSGEWSKSYLAEQLWRNYLGLSADYHLLDLGVIAKGRVVD